MDDEQTQDVNQLDGQTTDTSSDVNQTAPDAQSQQNTDQTTDTNIMADGTPEDQKTVPYSVFKEVREELRGIKEQISQNQSQVSKPAAQQQEGQLTPEQKAQAAKVLSDLGFVSKEDLQRQQQDQALQSTLSGLEKELNGKDGRPVFNRKDVVDYCIKNGIANPKSGYELMHQTGLIDWHVKQALTKGTGLQTEGSNGSGSQNTGVSNDDLKDAAAKGDPAARKLLIKRAVANTFFKGS